MDKPRILIVEDEVITAMDIKDRLLELGYLVPDMAVSGEEAIAIAEKTKPDLILMDIVLKGEMDGTQAAQHIAAHSQIPVIFLTAYKDEATFNRAKSSAPYGYLTKPFETRELEMTVELTLFKHKMERESASETTRVKNEFLSNMAHEIRTPLTGIIGFAGVIHQAKTTLKDVELEEYSGNILTSANSLLRLLSNILDLTEAESNTMSFHPEKINPKTTIDEVAQTLRELMEIKKIDLEIKIDPTLEKVLIDSEKFKLVIHNYLSNAIKFSKEGGKIQIYADTENESHFCIKVKDEGIGIPAAELKNLFVPFKQLDMSAAKKYQGSGLGLALTRHVVEAQGGRVVVESVVDKGSTFSVILPIDGKENCQ